MKCLIKEWKLRKSLKTNERMNTWMVHERMNYIKLLDEWVNVCMNEWMNKKNEWMVQSKNVLYLYVKLMY